MADLDGIWLMTTGGDSTPYRTAEDDTPYIRNKYRENVRAETTMLDPSIRRLCLGIDTHETAWMVDGACAGQSHDAWFPEDNTQENAATIRKICGGCPVREKCLDWGVEHDEWGMWGGLGQRARRELRAERKAARRAAS